MFVAINEDLPKLNLPDVKFDENLREVAITESEFLEFIQTNSEKYNLEKNLQFRRHYSEYLGIASRIINKLDDAELYLKTATVLSDDKSKQIQNTIRLAHVYQWKKQFQTAKVYFDLAKAIFNEHEISHILKAAYHQHLGKFYFDQELYGLAMIEFETANKIRTSENAPADQIESTKIALAEAKKRGSVKLLPEFCIRKALLSDIENIHTAHMLSINEICNKDHSPDEIRVWGGRKLEQVNRVPGIKNDLYLVVEYKNNIEGFCNLKPMFKNGIQTAHLYGLYITPKILKMKIGDMFMNLIFEFFKSENIKILSLKSSITAFEFYKKYGFIQMGELTGPVRDGVVIRGYPMEKVLI